MGRYFRMSRRFHKSAPEDFGLVYLDADTAKDPDALSQRKGRKRLSWKK